MAQDIKGLNRQSVPAGTLVIRQGATGRHAYAIESGKVEVFITDTEGKDTIVAELGPESLFGEMSVIVGGLRSASVRTVTDSVLITISAEDMQASIRNSTSLYTRLVRLVNDRMSDNNLKLLGKKPETPVSARAAPVTLKDLALHVARPETEEGSVFAWIKSTLEKVFRQ